MLATKGHNLPYKKMYHVLLKNYRGLSSLKSLREAVKTCLENADRSGFRSIAFPILGAGGFSYPSDRVIQVIQEECSHYQGSNLLSALILAYRGDMNSINVRMKLMYS